MYELTDELHWRISKDLGQIEGVLKFKMDTNDIEVMKAERNTLRVIVKELWRAIQNETERQDRERDEWANEECKKRIANPI